MNSERKFYRLKANAFFSEPSLLSKNRKIIDVGIGGIKIHASDKLEIGKRFDFEIFLNQSESLSTTVEVVWVEELKGKGYDVGLKFIQLPPDIEKHFKTIFDREYANDF